MANPERRSGRRAAPPSTLCAGLLAVSFIAGAAQAQDASASVGASADPAQLESIQVTGNWLGTGLQTSVKNYAGARTVVTKEDIEHSGAASIDEMMRRIPGVQATENSGTAGSAISLNIGVRGLTGRYSPRSTVLLDGIPLAVAPYGQPQLSFAPVSLNNLDSIDVVRGGGSVRYGPQNVGGIINFSTRRIPGAFTADAAVRENEYTEGPGRNTQYSAFIGTQLDNGLGVALLYSGMTGSEWRARSDERVDDVSLKLRYELTPTSEINGKISYNAVQSRTPGGLTVAQFDADPYQNTRPTDYWMGTRKAVDVGYLNALSATQEFEIRTYYNDSFRQSVLTNAANTQLTVQPRTYQTIGVEPRYTQRVVLGPTTHDVTVGYRYIRERGDDASYNRTIATDSSSPRVFFDNQTDAHAGYIDDRIAWNAWRFTPGVRYEHIESDRTDRAARQTFETNNNKFLPSASLAYLVTPALTLFTNYGTSFGPVQNLQLNSQTPQNPLKPELARTTEFGARLQDGRLSAEITAFKLRFDNQIQLVPGSSTLFQNIGATKHEGVEAAARYAFARDGALKGVDLYANYTYTRALQESGATAGLDLPFYSRTTDTVGARYTIGPWSVDASTTHQTAQFSDNANTDAEPANASTGRVPGFRLWNAQIGWKIPGTKVDMQAGVNNLTNRLYYTRNVDGNAGRMVGPPRTVYVQGRLAF